MAQGTNQGTNQVMEHGAVEIGGVEIAVWSPDQRLKALDPERRVVMTRFKDAGLYSDLLIARALELKDDAKLAEPQPPSRGGTKVFHPHLWGSAAAMLVHLRALALYREIMQTPEAVVDAAWLNIYLKGDYSAPHSHVRAKASVVYVLDPGDDDLDDPEAAAFAIIDPRFDPCCAMQKGAMTNPMRPKLVAGSMILFPPELVHWVSPYRGTRPRMTFSWNIGPEALAGNFADEQFRTVPRG